MLRSVLFAHALCLLVAVLADGESSHVIELTSENFEEKTKDSLVLTKFYAPWCGHCKKLVPTWEHLANELQGKANIAKVDCTIHKDLCAKFSITGYPTLKLLENGEEKEKYQGARTATALATFLKEKAGLAADAVVTDLPEPKREVPPAAPAEPEGPTDVEILTDANFEEKTKEGEWFIKFYAPWCGHCKSLAPTWNKLATSLKGKANIAKVDCTIHKNVCTKFGIRGYPTLKLISNGEEKTAYNGGRDLPSFGAFLKTNNVIAQDVDLGVAPAAQQKLEKPAAPPAAAEDAGDVVVLNTENFEEKTKEGFWFIKFYAPWCGHCKKLVPAWGKLATMLKDKTNIAKVDCTVDNAICSKFGVRGYPTLKLLKDGEEHKAYSSARDIPAFVKFLKENGVIAQDIAVDVPAEKVEAAAKPPAAAAEEGPTDVEILTEANFEEKTKEGEWFIKFYAPWCGHCKRLAPVWDKLGTAINKGQSNYKIGKVDCTQHNSVCSSQGVRGYPTLKYFKDGKADEEGYRGNREFDDFMKFLTGKGYSADAAAEAKHPHHEL